eukprot:1475076-Rhodomonas_salina.2
MAEPYALGQNRRSRGVGRYSGGLYLLGGAGTARRLLPLRTPRYPSVRTRLVTAQCAGQYKTRRRSVGRAQYQRARGVPRIDAGPGSTGPG